MAANGELSSLLDPGLGVDCLVFLHSLNFNAGSIGTLSGKGSRNDINSLVSISVRSALPCNDLSIAIKSSNSVLVKRTARRFKPLKNCNKNGKIFPLLEMSF